MSKLSRACKSLPDYHPSVVDSTEHLQRSYGPDLGVMVTGQKHPPCTSIRHISISSTTALNWVHYCIVGTSLCRGISVFDYQSACECVCVRITYSRQKMFVLYSLLRIVGASGSGTAYHEGYRTVPRKRFRKARKVLQIQGPTSCGTEVLKNNVRRL